MYHNINALCKKIDLIKEKADKLQQVHRNSVLDTGHSDAGPQLQFEIEDIQALCRDIANDTHGSCEK